jgi:drug/metabolite transporter (DMT)-like permease
MPPTPAAEPSQPPSQAPAPGWIAQDPLRAIALVLASTVVFAVSDTAAKVLTQSIPPIQATWLRFLVFLLIVVPAGLLARGPRLLSSRRPGVQVLRGIALAGAAMFFMSGLRHLPVADMTALNFIAPLLITALSIPLLGERVDARRWIAALVGLAGVLMIVRPGTSAFDPAALLPLGSALAWALAAILTRLGAGDPPETTLAFSSLVGFVVLCCFVPFAWGPMTARDIGLGVFVAVLSTAGHWLVVLAFRRAPASVLAPFSYAQLISATVCGLVVFGDLPGLWTAAGAAVIAASGLYTAHRERALARAAATPVGAAGSPPG